MRPLEIFAFLLAALPVLALAGRLRTSIGIAAALLSCGILVFSAFKMGAYWQLLPLYLAAVGGLTGLLVSEHRLHKFHAIAAAAQRYSQSLQGGAV